MKNNNRLYYLLTAGTLTVLLFATVSLFGGNFLGAVADAATNDGNGSTILKSASMAGLAPDNGAIDNAPLVSVTQANPTADATLTTLQAQNAKLIQMVQTMQERERQYQAQLQTATQSLKSAPAASAGQHYVEREHDEDEEAEHEQAKHDEDEGAEHSEHEEGVEHD